MLKKVLISIIFCSSLYAADISKFSLPVPEKYRNNISSGQGLRETILSEEEDGVTLGGMFHNGIDWAVPYGTPVYATKDGIVVINYPGKGNNTPTIIWKGHEIYGSCILLEHNDGTYSLYAHLSKTLVTTGQVVEKGQEIAASGGTGQAKGRSNGNHLHWAVYIKLSDILEF